MLACIGTTCIFTRAQEHTEFTISILRISHITSNDVLSQIADLVIVAAAVAAHLERAGQAEDGSEREEDGGAQSAGRGEARHRHAAQRRPVRHAEKGSTKCLL